MRSAPDAPAPCLAAASARVLVFSDFGRQRRPEAWERVAEHEDAPALAQALDGFASVRDGEDPRPFRKAMFQVASYRLTKLSDGLPMTLVPGLADVVLRLQGMPRALDLALKLVEHRSPGLAGINPLTVRL